MNSNISELKQKMKESAEFIENIISEKPEIGIILGTGLGGLADDIEKEQVIDYYEIPNFVVSTVEGHAGRLIFGKLGGKNVMAMQGRFHFYEGYSMQQITFPIRVMKALGIETMIVSNACGSVNNYMLAGSVMIIDDHINLLGTNPLIGPNDDSIGLRFPDMSEPYSQELIELAEQAALENNIKIHKGVYAALSGPSLETRAEYRMLNIIGADVVGMSTVPEVIVANHMNMKCLGLSVITDVGFPVGVEVVTLEKVMAAAKTAEPKMNAIIRNVIRKL